jgi:thymidine kinase
MSPTERGEPYGFLKSLGFPEFAIHHAFNHFDFTRPSRRILVIGPMGSGKTEYSSRVWRDSRVALRKSEELAGLTRTGEADRRNVFVIRSSLDAKRFPDYPTDALAYRGGFERCGERISKIGDSFELEQVIAAHPEIGTWIIDEASFYDERLAYVVRRESEERGLVFIFPALILNFRKEIFNATARLLLEHATDLFPLTAYCEHESCLTDSFYTYRYYMVEGRECPALFFDPLIIIGGDAEKDDPREPNYCTRCEAHHYLPGKEYTYLILKPLGVAAASGDLDPLRDELRAMHESIESSRLSHHLRSRFGGREGAVINLNALEVPCIAEKALIFLYSEENLISADQLRRLSEELALDGDYIHERLADNRRLAELL